jgi:hypothetical protein
MEDVRQSHEGDERRELGRHVTQANLAPRSQRGEAEARECLDRHDVRLGAADVADCDLRAARSQESADALTQLGEVVSADRPADRELDDRGTAFSHDRQTARPVATHRRGSSSTTC